MKGQTTSPFPVAIIVSFLVLLVIGQSVEGQSTRTWVSVNGNDANDCSRAAPCRTLSGAFAKSSAGGEIDVLDSGDFGVVTFTRAISVVAPGVLGGIQAGAGAAITVNAGSNDKVVLRGLTIDGLGTGVTGVSFISGGYLYIESCTINNFGSYGVEFAPTTSGNLFVTDSVLRNNGAVSSGGGIIVKPSGSGIAKAALTRALLLNNNFGLRSDGGSSTAGVNVAIKGGSASGNTNSGIIAVSASAPTQVMVDGVEVSNNGFGVRTDGVAATLRFGNTTVSGNGTGMSAVNGGQLLSYGNNKVDGNAVDGTNPLVIPTK